MADENFLSVEDHAKMVLENIKKIAGRRKMKKHELNVVSKKVVDFLEEGGHIIYRGEGYNTFVIINEA